MTGRVWVIDTSAIINCKHVVSASRQWELFERLKELGEAGQLFFPKKVAEELRQARYHDTPETWALNVSGSVVAAHEPLPQYLSETMAVAGDVVEADSEADPGDPYVLAQALELRSNGYDPLSFPMTSMTDQKKFQSRQPAVVSKSHLSTKRSTNSCWN